MNTDKQLLLTDLSARLLYNVICYNTLLNCNITLSCHLLEQIMANENIYIKPFIRPMSSMTEEEIKEFYNFCVIDEDAWMGNSIKGCINQSEIMSNGIDWLNKHHLDYNGLIPMNLALPAKDGMYNFK